MALVNVTARFGLELVGVGAIGLWAASVTTVPPLRVAAGVAAAAFLIVVWALLVAPKAANPIPQDVRVIIGSALLILAAGGLAMAGHRDVAAVFSVAVVVNTVLLFTLPEGAPGELATAGWHRS